MPPYSQMSPQQQQLFHQLLMQHMMQQQGGPGGAAAPGMGQAIGNPLLQQQMPQGMQGMPPGMAQPGGMPQGQGFNLSALLPYLLGQGGAGQGGGGINLAQLLRGAG